MDGVLICDNFSVVLFLFQNLQAQTLKVIIVVCPAAKDLDLVDLVDLAFGDCIGDSIAPIVEDQISPIKYRFGEPFHLGNLTVQRRLYPVV